MNKPVQKFIGGIFGFEFVRRSLEAGYVPSFSGEHIERVVQPNLYWFIVAVMGLGAVATVFSLIRALAHERVVPTSAGDIENEKRSFLAGDISIAYSTVWCVPVILGLLAFWLLYVFLRGEVAYESWFVGYWFSALLFLFLSSYLTGWSVVASSSGDTLVFKRLFSVTGNLALPVTKKAMRKGVLELRNTGAMYSIPITRLSPRDREIICAAFSCREERR